MSKGSRQMKEECRTCQEINFDHITGHLQTDYQDRYEGIQAEMDK